MGRILVGTSGYVYRHWKEILYPDIPATRWLARYTAAFPTVELNATFYRLPSVEAVRGWRDGSPPGYVFACKGSRYVTHNKKLNDPVPGVAAFFERIRHLDDKLGPVVWQLPPQLKRADLPRLERFLAELPRDLPRALESPGGAGRLPVRHVIEFRSGEWYTEATCALLDRYGVAFCEHDLVDRPPPRPTGGFRYLRFHGPIMPERLPYGGRYGPDALAPVAGSLRRWRDEGRDAYAYFNNDVGGHALHDASDLAGLVGLRAGIPPHLHPAASRPRAG